MLIQLGILDYKFLIILILPFFREIQKIYYEKHDKADNAFFIAFNEFSACTFCGFIYILTKYLTKVDNQKKKEKENEKNENKIELELKSKEKDSQSNKMVSLKEEIIQSINISNKAKIKKLKIKKRNKILFLLLLTGLHMSALFLKNFLKDKINKNLLEHIPAFFEIIFLISFSIIFLGYSLYLHQYVSMVLIGICSTIFLLESGIYTEEVTTLKFIVCILYYFSYEIVYCLLDVLGKKYLNLYIDGVYLFLFKISLISLIPLLLYDTIAYFKDLDDKYHGIIRVLFIDLSILNSLLFFFLSVIIIIGVWLVIYYFSPCHFIIIETIGDFINIIYTHFIHKEDEHCKKGEVISFIILYPFLIFCVLLFNEVIILNFFKLNYNTKYYILQRAKIDSFTDKILLLYSDEESNENDNDKGPTLY